MHSSAVLAILVVAASAPAFSAPLTSSDVFSREAPTSQVDAQNESGALSLGDIISGLTGLFSKREDIDLLARHDGLLQREYAELFARDTPNAQVDPESGALNIPGLIDAFGGLIDSFAGKREDLELFARSLANEEILKRGNGVNPALFARAYDDLLTRADPSASTNDSGAISIPGIINGFGDLIGAFFNKRKELELLTRADPSASTDESGAISIPGIIKGFGDLFDTFFNKREELKLLARSLGADDELLKREFLDLLSRADQSTNESGALNIPKIIGGFFDTFFGSKREELEILARDYALQTRRFEARSLNELD